MIVAMVILIKIKTKMTEKIFLLWCGIIIFQHNLSLQKFLEQKVKVEVVQSILHRISILIQHCKVRKFCLDLCQKFVLVQYLQGSQAMEIENAKMLESLLPSKFKYKINEVKILEKSELLEEVKFHADWIQ